MTSCARIKSVSCRLLILGIISLFPTYHSPSQNTKSGQLIAAASKVLHHASSAYPDLMAFKKALSADIFSVVQIGGTDDTHADRCIADYHGPYWQGRLMLATMEILSSSLQNVYGWCADLSAFARISGDGKQDSTSTTVFSSPLMWTIFASNWLMNFIQHAWWWDKFFWVLKFSSVLWLVYIKKGEPNKSTHHFFSICSHKYFIFGHFWKINCH